MAVWSDSRATLDYQNLLAGKAQTRLADGPSVVIGDEPLASYIAAMAPGEPDLHLPNNAAIPERPGPIYVMVPPSQLPALLQRCPDSKKEDLVFVNCGDMIEPTLKQFGRARDTQTQAVLYLAVNEYGKVEDDRVSIGADTMGQPKHAAESCVTGKWSGALADRLHRHDFYCAELFYRDWRRNMLERVAFESVFNLVGVLHQNVPLKEVPEFFGDEVDDMMWEIQRLLRGHLAVTLLTGYEERMAAYAAQHYRSKNDNKLTSISLDRATWRNKFFYDISVESKSRDFPDPAPMHTEYWEYGLANNLFTP